MCYAFMMPHAAVAGHLVHTYIRSNQAINTFTDNNVKPQTLQPCCTLHKDLSWHIIKILFLENSKLSLKF